MRAKWISAASPAGMAQGVVEQLEPIEIGVDQRARRGPARLGLADQLVELAPVGEPGQAVRGGVGRALVGLERPGEPRARVGQRLRQLGQRGADRLAAAGRPDGDRAEGLVADQDRQQHHGARPLAPVGHHAAQRIALHRELRHLAAGHAREVADLGHHGVEQTPVAAARDADDPHLRQRRQRAGAGVLGRGLLGGDDDLRVERALELVGQPKADASDGLERRLLASAPGPAPRSAAAGGRRRAAAGGRPPPAPSRVASKPVGQQQPDRGAGRRRETPACRCPSARPRSAPGPAPARAAGPPPRSAPPRAAPASTIRSARGPSSRGSSSATQTPERAVGAAEPFERGIGQQMGADPARAARRPARRRPSTQPDPGARERRQDDRERRSSRSQPRRRNHR